MVVGVEFVVMWSMVLAGPGSVVIRDTSMLTSALVLELDVMRKSYNKSTGSAMPDGIVDSLNAENAFLTALMLR
jgi:hypothetical protein